VKAEDINVWKLKQKNSINKGVQNGEMKSSLIGDNINAGKRYI
jgi:hypothetical protein